MNNAARNTIKDRIVLIEQGCSSCYLACFQWELHLAKLGSIPSSSYPHPAWRIPVFSECSFLGSSIEGKGYGHGFLLDPSSPQKRTWRCHVLLLLLKSLGLVLSLYLVQNLAVFLGHEEANHCGLEPTESKWTHISPYFNGQGLLDENISWEKRHTGKHHECSYGWSRTSAEVTNIIHTIIESCIPEPRVLLLFP